MLLILASLLILVVALAIAGRQMFISEHDLSLLWVLMGFGVVASLAFGLTVSGPLTEDLARISSTSSAIAHGDLAARYVAPSRDPSGDWQGNRVEVDRSLCQFADGIGQGRAGRVDRSASGIRGPEPLHAGVQKAVRRPAGSLPAGSEALIERRQGAPVGLPPPLAQSGEHGNARIRIHSDEDPVPFLRRDEEPGADAWIAAGVVEEDRAIGAAVDPVSEAVEGPLDAHPSLGAKNKITIPNNIVYEGGRVPASDDMLGLVANNFVEIMHPVTSSGSDIRYLPGSNRFSAPRIDAAILSVEHSFRVQNYNEGSAFSSPIDLYGTIAQLYRGPVGTFSGSSTDITREEVLFNSSRTQSSRYAASTRLSVLETPIRRQNSRMMEGV